AGDELNLTKSEKWRPVSDSIELHDIPAAHRGVLALALQPASERLRKDELLGHRVQSFLGGSADARRASVAWWRTSKCMKEAWSHDIRILPASDQSLLLERLAIALREVATVIGEEMLAMQHWR
ncbi:unnamed protein product, partial [Prorocentrum cordatum]